MAQPPAWLRHQAVEASARAIVSITWKNVIGAVSMPPLVFGMSRRNSFCSCSLSSRAGGRRRLVSISGAAAATAGRTASARAITPGSPARSVAVSSVSKPLPLSVGDAGGKLAVDLLVRLAAGLDAEEIIDHAGHQEPAAEIGESGRNLRQRNIGFEVVAGTDDQGQPDRTQDLADAAEAIGRTHAAGLEMRRPDLRAVWPDDREAAVGEEHRRREDQPEGRNTHDHARIVVARQDDQHAGTKAQ